MVVSEVDTLTMEFHVGEIGTWETYGSKQVWQLEGES